MSDGDDLPARIFNILMMILIVLNVAAVTLETVKSIHVRYETFFYYFEITSVLIFTIEYLLRLWSCTSIKKYEKSFSGRIRFVFSPMALVDLLAVLPFYLPMFVVLDLRFLRAIRLMRLFRLFKLGRYSSSLKMLGNVFVSKKAELFITFFVLLIILILSSSMMYFFENEKQPEQFSSIPASMWWGVSTLTTVGYGDIYPLTPLGKFFGALISIIGIGVFALPAGVIASGLIEEMYKKKNSLTTPERCPHCGKNISSAGR